MLFMFDTRKCIQDLTAGGIPEPQAEAMTKVWLDILQKFQVALHPEQAALRLEQELYTLHMDMYRLQSVIDRMTPKEPAA